MKKINIKQLYYKITHKYLTLNNAVIVIAFCIAAGWVWGSLNVMQRNYNLQKELSLKQRELQVIQLETTNLELEQKYYRTQEYQELAARSSGLNLTEPGEKVLILPANSQAAINADKETSAAQNTQTTGEASNFQKWINFLFGGSSKSLQGD